MRETVLAGYFEKLADRCETADSSLCIGLDPDPRRFPHKLGNGPEGVYKFTVEIIEATADHAAAFKPNIAFYESLGTEGWHVLAQAMESVPREIPIIIDAKRGDIDSTAQHYARSIFERLKADAVTVNPFLGHDSVDPFLKFEKKGIYILCLTSNRGAKDFQLYNDLYLRVAKKARDWNEAKNIGLVVGATKPKQLAEIQRIAPNLPILIPGLGAQGGDLDKLLETAADVPRHHMLFNVSRSILFASEGSDYGRAARKAALYYREMINKAREKRDMLEGMPPDILKMLESSGAYLSGHFILSSGRHSGHYMQCALLCAVPEYCEELAKRLAAQVKKSLGDTPCESVIAPALGGVVIGYEAARQVGALGYFTERDKEGVMSLRRGFEINNGDRILIVEDVITTGGSVLEVARITESHGGKVVGFACLFNRSGGKFKPGPPVFALADLSFPTYTPEECPLCKEGKTPAVKPGSKK